VTHAAFVVDVVVVLLLFALLYAMFTS